MTNITGVSNIKCIKKSVCFRHKSCCFKCTRNPKHTKNKNQFIFDFFGHVKDYDK